MGARSELLYLTFTGSLLLSKFIVEKLKMGWESGNNVR